MCSAARYSPAASLGPCDVVAVRLVDGDHVGDLDHALLDALQLVASAGQHQHEEKVGHVRDRRLGLPDANRLDQDHVEAGGFADQHGLARLRGNPAERPGRGRGADEGIRVVGKPGHAGLVAQNGTPGAGGGGVHCQHRNFMAFRGEIGSKGVDGGRFSHPGRAGNANADRLAGFAEEILHQKVRGLLMIRPLALHQRDRAREARAITAAQLAGQGRNIGGNGHCQSASRGRSIYQPHAGREPFRLRGNRKLIGR